MGGCEVGASVGGLLTVKEKVTVRALLNFCGCRMSL